MDRGRGSGRLRAFGLLDAALWGNDLQAACRAVRRRPLIGVTCVGTLSLGIAVLLAIYALLDSVVLEDLPYPAANRLVDIYSSVPGLGFDRWEVSEAGYLTFARESQALTRVGAYRTGSASVDGQEGVRRVAAVWASPSLLDVLGVQALHGRVFGDGDAYRGAAPVALLSHSFWVDRFGSDPAAVGAPLQLLGRSWTITGVLPEGFELPMQHTDVWLPLAVDDQAPDADSHSIRVIGRTRTGATIEAVQKELDALTVRLSDLFPNEYSRAWMTRAGFHTVAQPLQRQVVDSKVRTVLWLLMGSAAVVLFIALGNVVNLVLGRNLDRLNEFGLRQAVGARVVDVLRLVLVEGLLVSIPAGALGIAAAGVGVSVLSKVGPMGLPRLSSLAVDGSAVTLAVATVVVLSMVLGGASFIAVRRSLPSGPPVRAGAPSTTGRRHFQFAQRILVVGQIAFTVGLLCGSGLLVRSFARLVVLDPGFRPRGVSAVDIFLPESRYADQEAVRDFYRRLLERVRSLPGVEEAGAGTALPLEPGLGCYAFYSRSDPLAADEQPPCIDIHVVTPGYFKALGVTMVEGRGFEEADNSDGTGALVVTRPLARRLWPGVTALGEGASIHGYRAPWFTVVGVTGGILADGLDRPPSAAAYLPLVSPEGARRFLGHRAKMTVVARTSHGNPLALVPAMRGVVRELDPSVATGNPRRMTDVVARSRGKTTLAAGILLLAALVGLLLGTLGLYATMAHDVNRRTREIGVRIAVGAGRGRVLALIVRRAGSVVATGLVVGFLAYWAAHGLLQSLLFGVSPADLPTFCTVTVVVLLVSGLSTVVAAWKAVAVDPTVALRVE